VWRALLSLAALSLALTSPPSAAESPGGTPAPVAHSALLTLEAAPTATGLTLRVVAGPGQPPTQISEIAVTLDGKPHTATARADGGFDVALSPAARAGAGQLEVTVAHDGIREVLSGRVTLESGGSASPVAPSAGSASRKQLWWWVLNIAIVLIAAIAISRRTS